MKITLINPPTIDRKDNITLAITMPLGLAYLASYLKAECHELKIIDAIGEGITSLKDYRNKFFIRGLSFSKIINKIPKDTELIGISGLFTIQHDLLIKLIKLIKQKKPDTPLILGGNHVSYNYKEFLRAGADYIVIGEGEKSFSDLCKVLQKKKKIETVSGIAYKKNDKIFVNKKKVLIKDLDCIPFPDWNFIPLKNYYQLNKGHAPTNAKFTSIISSRGCPHNCTYCASAVFWKRQWRARSVKNVVSEIEALLNEYNITEFHFDDDNLTLDKKRFEKILYEIIKRGLKIKWSAASGIRPENIDKEMLYLMKKSGCTHITLAPESGSQKILKKIFMKNIELNQIIKIIKWSNKIGIKTAAYILIGAPQETTDDISLTEDYIKKLAKNGLDELAVFPVIPYPETEIAKYYGKINNSEEFITGIIPNWHPRLKELKSIRKKFYIQFLANQLIYHPLKIIKLIKNFIFGKQETKTDRVLKSIYQNYMYIN